MKTIYLTRKQIPAQLIGNYTGNKFQLVVADKVTLNTTYWSGGSRNTYRKIGFNGGSVPLALNSTAPQFGPCSDGESVEILPGFAVVKHCVFDGADLGLTFYINPADLDKFELDTSESELTRAELCLLDATAGLKASYAGRKPRIDMMHSNGFDNAAIDSAKQSLIEKKMLRANGSITPLGRNNRPQSGEFKQY